jgi:REP element-mobilizing transposase RayT
MVTDEPLAYFLTWTMYGTHLQGDELGWRRRRRGEQLPQPRLVDWRRQRLKHAVLTLTPDQRYVVEHQVQRHCAVRDWRAWAVNARSTHVHAVVTAVGYSGATVRDQLKANATRGLREQWPTFLDRPVWTTLGDWECVNDVDDLEQVCQYVRDAQDSPSRR